MDLAFRQEEIAFSEEVRAFVRHNVPPETRRKSGEAVTVSQDELGRLVASTPTRKAGAARNGRRKYGGTG